MLQAVFSGFEDARSRLAVTVAPLQDKRILARAEKALEPVVMDAKRLAPVESGDLRDSIGVSTRIDEGGSTDGKTVYVGVLSAGAAGGGGQVFYGHFFEFGTVHMRARPFLAPAVHENRELIFDILGKGVGADMVAGL